jgi:hypothetical protein
LAYGGLKPETVRLLRSLAAELRSQRSGRSFDSTVAHEDVPVRAAAIRPILSPGTQLMREWNGSTEIVDVTREGLVWRGKTYRTLSAVAVAITGTKWSGPKFFGLTPAKPCGRAKPSRHAEHAKSDGDGAC